MLGRNAKVWVREPGGARDRQGDWLFKPVVMPNSTGHLQGEDRAEKVVSELGVLLRIPCAPVELAVRDGWRGSISRNVVPPGRSLVLGSVLLGSVISDYRSGVLDVRESAGRFRVAPATVWRTSRSPSNSVIRRTTAIQIQHSRRSRAICYSPHGGPTRIGTTRTGQCCSRRSAPAGCRWRRPMTTPAALASTSPMSSVSGTCIPSGCSASRSGAGPTGSSMIPPQAPRRSSASSSWPGARCASRMAVRRSDFCP